LSDDQVNVQNGLDAQGLGEDDIDQNDPERKRRRRRSRRGRRGADEGSIQDGREDQTSENAGFDHVSSNALSGAPVNYVQHGSTPASTAAVNAQPVSAPVAAPVVSAPVVSAPVAAPVVSEPVVAAPATVAPIAAAPVVSAPVQVTSVVEQTASATAPIPALAPTSAPVQVVTAPSAPIVVPAPRADNATLHAIVQSAGLQWVESDPVRVAQAMANQRVTPIKLGREPKPRVAVSSEPLVQVETIR
jgi:ribonuclease E